MKKLTPLAAVLSFGFLAVIIAAFSIVLFTSSQRDGSFASPDESPTETPTPQPAENTEVMVTPTAAVLTITPAITATLPELPPVFFSAGQGIGEQIDILIRALNPEFYTYNEILVDDNGVQVREARYYNNDSFIILTERMAADQPLPQGEEIVLGLQPVILVEGLQGEALLVSDTLQDGISRPFLGGGGGGGGGGGSDVTPEIRLFPEVIEYTDASMIVWNMDGEQISMLTNLPKGDLLGIANLAMQLRLGTLAVGIPELIPISPEPGFVVFEYNGPDFGFVTTVEGVMFEPLQPHHLPAALFTSQDDDEIFGADAVGSVDGSSVELRVYKVMSEEFIIIRQSIPAPAEILSPSDADEVIEVNGLPAVMIYNPECSLEVPDPDAEGAIKKLMCTDSWSLNWFAEGLRLEVIGNNLPQSEAVQIANNLQLD